MVLLSALILVIVNLLDVLVIVLILFQNYLGFLKADVRDSLQ